MDVRSRMLAFILGLGACAGAGAQTVSIVPSLSNVTAGDVFSVSVMGSGFPSAVDGGGFNLAFNGAVVHVESITFDPVWNFVNSPGSTNNSAGTVTDAFFSTLNTVSGNFTIGTIGLRAFGVGTSLLELGSSPGNPFGSGGNPIDVAFVAGTVNVAAIPEPSTYLMLLAGLGVLGAIARRRSA